MEFTNTINILNKIGQLAEDKYKNDIKNGAFATGKLFNSINYHLEITDTNIKLSFNQLEDYYIKVEKGQKPGENTLTPEFIGKIYKWMLVKKIPTKANRQYLIARSIVNKGVKAKPYLHAIKINIKENYINDLKIALKKDIELNMKEKINEINNTNNNANRTK